MKTQIKLNYLAAAAICANREETRYYINGVLAEITESGTRFVATDGCRLIALLDTTGATGVGDEIKARAIIPLALCSPKIKRVTLFSRNKGNDKNLGWLDINDDIVRVEGDGVTYEAKAIDGTFPDWPSVIPKEASGEAGVLQGKYLVDFARINKMLTGDSNPPQVSNNGKKSAIVHFSYGTKGFGLVMPLRNDPPEWTVPDWVPVSEKKKAEKEEKS